MTAPDSASQTLTVDWDLFSVPIERSAQRPFPEHLIGGVRHLGVEARYRKQGFWDGLCSARWPVDALKGQTPRVGSPFRFYEANLSPTRDYAAEVAPNEPIRPSSHIFFEEVVEPAADRKSSTEIKFVPYEKIPSWVETRMRDVESQFFLRNIARYEIPLPPVIPFDRQIVRHTDWDEILEAARRYQRHEPELLMHWSTYFMAEVRQDFRQLLHFADWDDFFGVLNSGQLEKRRADALSRFYSLEF